MSEYRFGITAIGTDLHTQDIGIDFSLHLDEDTLSAKNIILTVNDKGAQRVVPFELLVDGRTVTLHLDEWAVPNQEYTLLIQPGVESVTGERLDTAVVRNFVFPSTVNSEIEITKPADFGKVSAVHVEWQEKGKTPVGRFYLELATDAAFYHVVRKVSVNETFYDTENLTNGQYFVRVRAEKETDDYGNWSDTNSFYLLSAEQAKDEPETPPEDAGKADDSESDDPIVILDDPKDAIQIVDTPENGVTPPYFDFKFNVPIDISGATVDIVREAF